MNLATLDLNLLRVFDALMEERSVTRAGIRLGVSQSAVSHSLARLRIALADELFVRAPAGLAPTPRAQAIGPRLHAGLLALHSALADEQFDPARATRVFTLAADPYARATVLPRVIARVRAEAPGVELRIRPGFAGVTDALDDGRMDMAIASYRRVPAQFGVQELLTERLVWAVRADHPAAAQPLTMERLAGLPHLVRVLSDGDDDESEMPALGHGLERRAMQDDDGALRRALAGIGARRNVRLTIPDSYAALAIVGETDLAALVPERMGRSLADRFGLVLFDPPYPAPSVPLSMVWHLGHGENPASRWLRTVIVSVAKTV